MSKWRIHPAGVQEILTTVDEQNSTLGKALTEAKFQAVFDGLTWAPGVTSSVPEAVSNVLNDQSTNLKNIGNRVNAGMVGVANAVIAYNNGQQDMSATYQTELLKSAETGDFSYFVDHGHTGQSGAQA